MRKSLLQLYAPFVGLILVQALLIAAAPSVGPTREPVGAFDPDSGQPVDGVAVGNGQDWITEAPDADFAFAPDGSRSADLGSGSGSRTGGQAPGAPRPDPTGPVTPGPGGDATADMSHCTEDGRQHGVIYHAPPCVPQWPAGADNGGATYRGVDAGEVRVVFFREKKNEQVTTLLNAEGLRSTAAEDQAFLEAAEVFLNNNFEFYGRQVKLIFHEGIQCEETPPTVPECKEEAKLIIDRYDPFIVLWPVPLYPEVFDVFAQNQVISIGGWHFDNRWFTGRRPYRYDVFMDGTATVEMLAEYYCKKLANNPATNTGRVIHPSIGNRGEVPRRLGIIVPEDEAFAVTGQHLHRLVSACDEQEPVLKTYEQNIQRAPQNASADITAMIQGGVTTMVCVCDPIAPIFRTLHADLQNYYPEHLMSGSGLLDYDKLGRLYHPRTQWIHAFGPSHLQLFRPFNETDAALVWRDAGRGGEPCQACNLQAAYTNFAGSLIQGAGPILTPQNVERGALTAGPRGGWQATGGRPDLVLTRLGPNDYTLISDAREVYWSETERSRVDGRPGAYAGIRGHRRYQHGGWDTTFEVPPAAP